MEKSLPSGYQTLTPFVIAEDAERVIKFAQEVFGARVVSRLHRKDGKVWNAELDVGTSKLLVSSAQDGQPGFPAFLYVYVDNLEDVYEAAVRAGGEVMMPPSDQFFGDRNAGVRDQDGNMWWFATRLEELSEGEKQRRAAEFERQQG